jgi:hypothetical protein
MAKKEGAQSSAPVLPERRSVIRPEVWIEEGAGSSAALEIIGTK